MKNPIRLTNVKTEKAKAVKVYGKVLTEQSSKASNPRLGGLSSSNQDRIEPRIPFWLREEYYLTVGRVQNVVESYVLNIINREWYYDDDSEGAYEPAVKKMEEWEENIELPTMFQGIIRNWIVNGVHIVSPKDWVPMQLQSIIAKVRDDNGNTQFYIQQHKGLEEKLPAKDFLELPYIDLDREPWGIGMFDSLMNMDYTDVDGKQPRASLDLYRQALQDNMKIHHKFASPRVIYTAEGVSKTVIDDDIVPVIEGMGPGDRVAFNVPIEIKQETVDGNARFIEHVNKIVDEIDIGLQSSANRLIAEPSAMADAREAGFQDDDKTLGLMEKVRNFMNKEVIPRVTGLTPGQVQFKWGSKDTFDLELPPALVEAKKLGVLTSQKLAIMLEENYRWKIPTDEDVIEKFGEIEDPLADQQQNDNVDQKQSGKPDQSPKTGPAKPKEESYYDTSPQMVKLEKAYQEEKLLLTKEFHEKLKEFA